MVPASRDTIGTEATAISLRRLSAAISPSMVPPRSTSITGNCRVSSTSPATTTSERRKNTNASLSVCAAGWCSTSIASPFRYMYFRA